MTAGGQAQPEVSRRHSAALPRLEPLADLVRQLYRQSGAEGFAISAADFQLMLAEVIDSQTDPSDDPDAIRDFLAALRVQELVLARACAVGNEAAWDEFLTRYRDGLYSAALAIAKDDVLGHELADSLYADLFGTEAPGGVRASKLNSYMGLGSLQGWLRTILAHTFIDRYRAERPLVSLTGEGEDEEDVDIPAPPPAETSPIDSRLEIAIDEALAGLSAEDRYLLASWFLYDRTLAELGRILGVHESTVSRRMDKLTSGLRKKILAGLIRHGMSRRQAEEQLEADVRDLQVNVRARLEENLQDSRLGPSLEQENDRGNEKE